MQSVSGSTFHRTLRALGTGIALAIALVSTVPTFAQCEGPWQSMGGVPGVDRQINAMTYWDPDGAGPQKQVLVVGGLFKVAGDVFADNIATWDGDRWHAFAKGIPTYVSENGPNGVLALATLPDGTLVAGGQFSNAGGTAVQGIAKWSGTNWLALGSVSSALVRVHALAVLPNGDLVAGGHFSSIGGVVANMIARWDGSAWHPLGDGLNWTVNALCVLDNGDLIVGGRFSTAGGIPANLIARWDGQAWHALGSGITGNPSSEVRAIAKTADDEVVAAGWFDFAGEVPATDVATWNGERWSALGPPLTEPNFYCLHIQANGDIIAGGTNMYGADPDGLGGGQVVRWDGVQWHGFGPSVWGWPPVTDENTPAPRTILESPDGSLIVGGLFVNAGTTGVSNIASWDGSRWHALGTGLNQSAGRMFVRANGDLIINGVFTHVSNVSAYGAAVWDGQQWSALSRTDDEVTLNNTNRVDSIRERANGDLIGVGTFVLRSGQWRYALVQWDGRTWNRISDLVLWLQLPLVRSNGEILASVGFQNGQNLDFYIGRLDGSSWTALYSPTGVSRFESLIEIPDGQLLEAEYDALQNNQPRSVRRGDGSNWTTLGGAFNSTISKIIPLPNGDILVHGLFSTVGGAPIRRLAQWNRQSWQAPDPAPPASMYLTDIVVLRDGRWVAVGTIDGNRQLIRFDNQAWTGTPVFFGGGMEVAPYRLIELPDGNLMIGGTFSISNGRVSGYLARYSFECCSANLDTTGSSATVVDHRDLLAVINAWGPCPQPCPPSCFADISQMPGSSCRVDVADLLAVIASWGVCP